MTPSSFSLSCFFFSKPPIFPDVHDFPFPAVLQDLMSRVHCTPPQSSLFFLSSLCFLIFFLICFFFLTLGPLLFPLVCGLCPSARTVLRNKPFPNFCFWRRTVHFFFYVFWDSLLCLLLQPRPSLLLIRAFRAGPNIAGYGGGLGDVFPVLFGFFFSSWS